MKETKKEKKRQLKVWEKVGASSLVPWSRDQLTDCKVQLLPLVTEWSMCMVTYFTNTYRGRRWPKEQFVGNLRSGTAYYELVKKQKMYCCMNCKKVKWSLKEINLGSVHPKQALFKSFYWDPTALFNANGVSKPGNFTSHF